MASPSDPTNSPESSPAAAFTATTKWTEPQQTAISTEGRSLLVSAAAGSGKTSVLAARCVRLITEGDSPCDIGELLVVTFTEKAAAEMKERIARSLARFHAATSDPHAAKQLAMLDRANISTIHGFCSRLLRQHFQLLGLDPEFSILDADEATLLKLETARNLFAERYDAEHDDAFRKLIDCYADGDDERLIRQVIDIYDTLCSVADSGGWLLHARDRIAEAIRLPMDQSELGREYLAYVARQLQSVISECVDAGKAVKAFGSFKDYEEMLRDLYRTLVHWMAVLKQDGLDALAEESGSVEFPRLKSMSNDIPNKAVAQDRLGSVRKMVKDGIWRQCLKFTTAEWKDGLARTLPHLDVLISLVVEFAEKYTAAKDEDCRLDFADLELLALRALKDSNSPELKPSAVARGYHSQFKHVLVDEYQDINEVQDAILTLISRECDAGRAGVVPNLFCVGDVKQSIYRFRLAEPARFLRRRDEYSKPDSHGQLIDLKENFRSRAPLLEAINGVFERLMTKASADLDYDQSQRLEPGLPYPDFREVPMFIGAPIELHLLPKEPPSADAASDDDLDRSEREAVLVGRRILKLVGRGDAAAKNIVDRTGPTPVARPVRFSDIVILMRSMRFKADTLAAVLRGMGIPVHTESVTGYFEATEINDVLALLHVLDNQRQDIPLAAVLRSPLLNLPDAESNFARIRLAYTGEPPVPFHLAVQKYAEEKTDALSEKLRAIQSQLEKWRQDARQRPVAELLWAVYEQTGYLAFNAGLSNGEQRQANLIELHDRARQFATFRRQGLTRFLAFLEKLKKDSDLGQASIASEADDVVRIMSIHKSKGLEFPVVFLPDLGKAINQQDSQGSILLDRSAGIGLQVVDEHRQIRYPSLAWTVVQQRIRQQTLAEELRVLYVAMTRAKEHLILMGTTAEDAVDRWTLRWADHNGSIPAESVLAARNVLDWIGPVAILTGGFAIHPHTAEEVAGWSIADTRAPKMSADQLAMAALKPIGPVPVMSRAVQSVIDRLGQKYDHADAALTPAAASVTSLVKKSAPAPASSSSGTAALPSQSVDRLLRKPAFLVGALPLDAADKGTATHAVLEHFQFDADAGDVHAQIDKLVAERKLTAELAAVVDIPAIEWFLQSEIGQLLRSRAHELKRELPVYFSSTTTGADEPADHPMVRGRIDLMLPTDTGWLIVDYKTDHVEGPEIETRAMFYAAQLKLYQDAVERITGQKVVGSALVFLHPKEIRRV
jgi:ATP-dependent helicase/nuclease subunit A